MEIPLAAVSGVALLALLMAYRELAAGKLLIPSLTNVSILFWITYPIGAIWILNDYSSQDEGWVLMNEIGPAAAMVGAITASRAKRFQPRAERRRYEMSPVLDDLHPGNSITPVLWISALSLGVALLHLFVAGTAISFDDIQQLLSGSDAGGVGREVTYQRKVATAGLAGYLAPGYVKQFRDVLLPASALLLYWHAKISNPNGGRFGVVLLVIAAATLMVVTAHRAPVTIFAAAMLMTSVHIKTSNSAMGLRTIATATGLGAVFAIMTLLLGRTSNMASPFQNMTTAAMSLLDRILLTYPRENFLTRSLWRDNPPQDGSEWLNGLLQILPGTQTGLGNRMHAMAGGSIEGNSVLNLWTDVWFNTGWFGLVILGFAIGFWLQHAWIRQLRRPKTITRVVFYSYWTFLLPFSMSPITFILSGAFSLFLYEKIINQWTRLMGSRRAERPAGPSITTPNHQNRRHRRALSGTLHG